MWSWVAHRITGVALFFFLFVHVLDTALVRVSPEAYNQVMETYKNPIVGLMEVGLVAAFLFHALNGLRVIAGRLLGQGPALPAADDLRPCSWSWAVLMVPFTDPPPRHVFGGSTDERPDPRGAPLHAQPGASNFELNRWLFMRGSGVLLVVLVLGPPVRST